MNGCTQITHTHILSEICGYVAYFNLGGKDLSMAVKEETFLKLIISMNITTYHNSNVSSCVVS